MNGEGALCSNCLTTAVECQHIFRDSPEDARRWCCGLCRYHGPRALHTVVS